MSKHSVEAADSQTCAELVEVKAEKLPLIKVWAVLVREENPPQGEEPIEWLLLTTVAVNSVEDAKERVEWYSCRWTIEIYHKVLKTCAELVEVAAA